MNATNKTASRRRAARGAGYFVGMALAAALPILAAAAPAHAHAEEQATFSSAQAVTSLTAAGEDDGLVPLPEVGDTVTDVVDDLVDIHDWG